MKRFFRHPLVLAILLLTVLVLGTFWLSALAGRIAVSQRLESIEKGGTPVTLEGLRESYDAASPPPGEDATPLLEEAFRKIEVERDELREFVYWPMRERTPGEPLFSGEAEVSVAELLESNREALEGLRAASRKSQVSFPMDFSAGFDMELPHVEPLRTGMHLLALSAGIEAEAGNTERAADDLVAIFRLAGLIADEPTIISHLTHIAGQSIGLFALEGVLSVAEFSEETIDRLDVVLRRAEVPVIRRALEGELAVMNAALDGRTGTEWAESMGLFYRVYARSVFYYRDWLRYLDVMEFLLAAEDVGEQLTISAPYVDFDWRLFWLRPGGIRIFMLERAFQTRSNSNALLRMARIALALERYRIDRGEWPEELTDLVPVYLETLPADPAGGEFEMTAVDGWLKIFSRTTIERNGEDVPLSVRLPLSNPKR